MTRTILKFGVFIGVALSILVAGMLAYGRTQDLSMIAYIWLTHGESWTGRLDILDINHNQTILIEPHAAWFTQSQLMDDQLFFHQYGFEKQRYIPTLYNLSTGTQRVVDFPHFDYGDAISLSPNGRNVFYWHDNMRYIFDTQTQITLPIPQIPADNMIFEWSPDSCQIAYLESLGTYGNGQYASGRFMVYDHCLETSRPVTQAFNYNFYDRRFLSWSPNGDYITYRVSLRGGSSYLRIVDVHSGETILSNMRLPVTHLSEPSWLPDENRFVISSGYLGNPSTFSADIYLIDVDNRRVQRLTDTPYDEVGARWSPDGEQIMFVSQMGNTANSSYYANNIFIMNVDGSGLRQITDFTSGYISPNSLVWLP